MYSKLTHSFPGYEIKIKYIDYILLQSSYLKKYNKQTEFLEIFIKIERKQKKS